MNSDQQFRYAAEKNASANCNMFADRKFINTNAAIILLMAVVFYISITSLPSRGIILSVISGIIILIVRGKIKPVSRTR